MSEYDDDAAAFYADPRNRESSGPPVRRKLTHRRLTKHIPVRFTAEMIESVKDIAAEDHMTVSSWIRKIVAQEIQRRSTPDPNRTVSLGNTTTRTGF